MSALSFNRTLNTPVVGSYKDYYNQIDYTNIINKYFEKEDLPYEVKNTQYDEKARILTINATLYLKAYGDSYSKEQHYKASRSVGTNNNFVFNNGLNTDLAKVLFPLGLTKTSTWYPSISFHYSEWAGQNKPTKLHWIDNIELNVLFVYD